MKTGIKVILTQIAFLLVAVTVSAQAPVEFATDPIGFNMKNCLSGSDTRVTVGFHLPPSFRGKLSTSPVEGSGMATLTVAGTPGWTPNQFAGSHYVRFASGDKAGFYYDVVSNGTGDVTIDLNGDTVQGVAAMDDSIKIIEHWTLDGLFPPGQQTTFVLSTGDLVFQQRSKLLIPDSATPGVNNPAANIFIIKSSGWADASGSSPFPAAGGTIIPPDSSFIIRHGSSDGPTEFVPLGHVEVDSVVMPLSTQSGVAQDNPVGLIRPIPLKLTELGFDDTSFQQSTGHLVFQRKDQLFAFDNLQAAFNKPAKPIFYKVGGTWFRDEGLGASNPVANNDELDAGAALVIRKATADGSTVFWKNLPTFGGNP